MDSLYGNAIRSNGLGAWGALQKLASFEYVERFFQVILKQTSIDLSVIITGVGGG